MDSWINWARQNLQVDTWGVTPLSLVAPIALVILILMAGRLSNSKNPTYQKRDVGGAVLITIIIGAAFLWIFAGVGLLRHY